MSTNFWELLQQHQGDLTKSGRTVAEYLVQHAAEAQYLSISSLARECQVAEATVFRFCRALGFEGYHEMRIALAQANATGQFCAEGTVLKEKTLQIVKMLFIFTISKLKVIFRTAGESVPFCNYFDK